MKYFPRRDINALEFTDEQKYPYKAIISWQRSTALNYVTGWDRWIRTTACGSQSPMPYRLAIPH